MEKEIIEKYKKAGKIGAQALLKGKHLIKKGINTVDIMETVEEFIISKGCGIAFPAQVSVNNVAAHSCDSQKHELGEDVVKLDVGATYEGYVSDNAVTVDLSGKYTDLLKTTKKSLDNAINKVCVGVKISEIGRVIDETLTEKGFTSMKNLTGHGIGKNTIHTFPQIPNYDNKSTVKLEKDMVIAIEPFGTLGKGFVRERPPAEVFMLHRNIPVRDPFSRKIMEKIKSYNGLPFCRRWLIKEFGAKANIALMTLMRNNALTAYPPLADDGIVAQFEHSMIVDEDKAIVTTKLD